MIRLIFRCTLTGLILLALIRSTDAQIATGFNDFWTASDTLNPVRVRSAALASGVSYTGFSIALYNTWYRQFEREGFHSFNDWNEWNNMDKAGHLYTTYFQSVLCYKSARWTGLDERRSILTGALCGALFQTTIEMMDAFSSKWGFSWSDMAFNALGTAAFVGQQLHWGDQRIIFKVSSRPKNYPTSDSRISDRADELFGSRFAERFLKDYNAQTYWASVNLSSVTKSKKIPAWLNVSLGYGSENLFGGFENQWATEDGRVIRLDDELYPRYRQYYIGPDIDFSRIKTKSPILKTLFTLLNIFRLPLPALEYNSLGDLRWRWLL